MEPEKLDYSNQPPPPPPPPGDQWSGVIVLAGIVIAVLVGTILLVRWNLRHF